MKKIIVTTTINPPTEAIERFDVMTDYLLVVIGDRKTPADYKLRRGIYVGPAEQEARYPRLSRLLGWNCIQRRNIGFLMALEMGADVVATIDDDNIPVAGWGRWMKVGETIAVKEYGGNGAVFDPIGATNYPQLWHRGFPIQMIPKRDYSVYSEVNRKVVVQADFWDGDPDIDAVCRMIFRPSCRFDGGVFPFSSRAIAPFNSQNTFLHCSVMPEYFMFPGIGRMDDIWGAYYLQAKLGVRPVFCGPTVEQRRNVHDLTKDFSQEVIGYEKNEALLAAVSREPDDFFAFLPGASVAAFLEYRERAREILAARGAF